MNIKRCSEVIHIVFLALIIAACGGGGGGDGSAAGGGGGGGGGGPTITQANAIVYAAGVLNLGGLLGIGDVVDFATSVQTVEKNKHGRFNLVEFVDWSIETLVNSPYQITLTSIVAVFPDPKDENCGGPTDGTVGLVWHDNDSNGFLSDGDSAVITFDGCKGALFGDDTITGTINVDVSSVSDSFPALPSFLSANITASGLLLEFATGSESDDLTLTVNVGRTDPTVASLTISGSVSGAGTDDGDNYSYSYDNLSLIKNKNGADYSILIQGDVLSSDLGEANINTSDAFTGNDNDSPDNPQTGNATVTAPDATSVTINVLDNIDVELKVDSDGDSNPESTINVTWEQLNNV